MTSAIPVAVQVWSQRHLFFINFPQSRICESFDDNLNILPRFLSVVLVGLHDMTHLTSLNLGSSESNQRDMFVALQGFETQTRELLGGTENSIILTDEGLLICLTFL